MKVPVRRQGEKVMGNWTAGWQEGLSGKSSIPVQGPRQSWAMSFQP